MAGRNGDYKGRIAAGGERAYLAHHAKHQSRAAAGHPIVDYRIWARLDTAQKAIDGQETLTWRNDSPDVIRELRFIAGAA